MSGVVVSPGDVVRLPFPHSDPPKMKICLCVCIHQGLFFIISTDPYQYAPADSQIRIFPEELECLDHESYLDVSKMYSFEQNIIQWHAEKAVWRLSGSALQRIKHIVQSQGYLPKSQKRLVEQNF